MIQRFRNLSIRIKVILILTLLLSIFALQIGASLLLSEAEADAMATLQESQAKTSQVQALQLAAQRTGKYETTATAQVLIEGPSAMNEPLRLASLELQEAFTIIQSLQQRHDGESPEMRQVNAWLVDNQDSLTLLLNELLPQRGNENSGLVGDLLQPLYVVHSSIDVTDTIQTSEDYALRFSAAASLRMPEALSSMATDIRNSALVDAKKRALLSQVDQARDAYFALLAHDLEMQQYFDRLNTRIEDADAVLDVVLAEELAAQAHARADFEDAQDLRRDLQYASALAAILLGLGLATTLTGQILSPVNALKETTIQLADGDYTARVRLEQRDEFGQLAAAFNNMAREVEVRDREIRQQSEKLEVTLEKAKEAAKIKSEFLSTMSHELRTPLHAIESFTTIMLGKMGGADYNAKTGDYLHRVSVNSKRLLALINDFLDLSRLEAGRLELVNMPFKPSKLAWRWVDELSVLAEKKNLNFVLDIDPSLPDTLLGDEEAISKIALNLLGNAIKFTEKGVVTLALRRGPGRESWEIEVSDTGIGIPPHAREYIFDEFRQVDQSSKRRFGGTGLGLSIVQKFARSMGGSVSLESEVGKGSTFTVALPLLRENP